jgi:hypothetical protein
MSNIHKGGHCSFTRALKTEVTLFPSFSFFLWHPDICLNVSGGHQTKSLRTVALHLPNGFLSKHDDHDDYNDNDLHTLFITFHSFLNIQEEDRNKIIQVNVIPDNVVTEFLIFINNAFYFVSV